MSGFRWNIEAFAGPARAGTGPDGRAALLVRVRLFDSPYDGDPTDSPYDGDPTTIAPVPPDAFTDLRTEAARDLAFELLAAAEHAEMLSRDETEEQ
jgi:hypothetical protein